MKSSSEETTGARATANQARKRRSVGSSSESKCTEDTTGGPNNKSTKEVTEAPAPTANQAAEVKP